MKRFAKRWAGPIAAVLLWSCTEPVAEISGRIPDEAEAEQVLPEPPAGEGALFIIGGGKRPPALVKSLVDLMPSNGELILVLPMASSEPDTSAYYAMRQFTELGCPNVHWLTPETEEPTQGLLDSLRAAGLIYFTGGDQNRLMKALSDEVRQELSECYRRGCVIAGTSAGAAVMSSVMITGDQQRAQEYESTYSRLMAENGVYSEGLGLFPNAIIDQHFVERSRYNRALTALHDHQVPVFGIGESTALIVSSSGYRVAGEGQVVVFSGGPAQAVSSGLIGMENIRLDVWLPGHSTDKK